MYAIAAVFVKPPPAIVTGKIGHSAGELSAKREPANNNALGNGIQRATMGQTP